MPVSDQPRRWPQFSMRTLLMLMMLLAMFLAWLASAQKANRQLALQAGQLRYAEVELQRARDALVDKNRTRPDKSRAFWLAEFDGANLRGATLASPHNAFQRASLRDCNLENAVLQGGVSAFQLAQFDRARLTGAKLTGGGASFQHATFVDADLTGAVLSGGSSSFQKASFERATLVGARLAGSFQEVNLSAARLEGADLSALRADDLASCYFQEPPSYNGQTRFPTGFDPEQHLWRRVSD